MCGIAGYILVAPISHRERGYIDALVGPIRKRGPDDEGLCLIDRERRLVRSYKTGLTAAKLSHLPDIADDTHGFAHDAALIHTRYSIIDLSEGGHQPFASQDGSVVAVVNGEIYNYIELREELITRGIRFRTRSDTEVLVEGYRIWGNDLWNRMNGFWAAVLYDVRRDELVFSRDRIGVAPLYYRELPAGFFFASLIGPLLELSPGDIELDEDVARGFVETGIKDHDHSTFYRQIRSMPPLTTVGFRRGRFQLRDGDAKRYWDYPAQRLDTGDISFDEAVGRYRDIFFNAVELRLRADVKVAFELSGGLDSSSVVAAAAVLKRGDVTTYTVSVRGADEEPYARAMLERYPLDYHVLRDLEGDFRSGFKAFSRIMEEPYDNPNAYSHHLMLSRMKSEGVSVVVTGAGGDEVLAGYESSFWPKAYEELRQNGFLWTAEWYEFCRRFKTLRRAGETLSHYALDLPGWLRRIWLHGSPGRGGSGETTAAANYQRSYGRLSFHEQALYHFRVALVPFYMRSSDHFTMSIPIEHRFPLLDFRMVELGLRMPIPYLFRGGWTKYLLRKAMEPYLPKKILWRRRKMGFAFPYRRYFTQYADLFEPQWNRFQHRAVLTGRSVSYRDLLKKDPVKLWRTLSTAIWLDDRSDGTLR
ncbi:MAG: asparagine synthase (glutamine-hydrolyzing) [Thermodesulfobacteriota bacterium]